MKKGRKKNGDTFLDDLNKAIPSNKVSDLPDYYEKIFYST